MDLITFLTTATGATGSGTPWALVGGGGTAIAVLLAKYAIDKGMQKNGNGTNGKIALGKLEAGQDRCHDRFNRMEQRDDKIVELLTCIKHNTQDNTTAVKELTNVAKEAHERAARKEHQG